VKTVNLFSGFKLFVIARTFVEIRHRRTLEFVGNPNILSKVPNFGIRLMDFGDDRLPESLPEPGDVQSPLSEFNRIRPNSGCIGQITGWNMVCRNLATATGHCRIPEDDCQILFFIIGIFFIRAKRQNNFGETIFFFSEK
jgi:hypothetical protein